MREITLPGETLSVQIITGGRDFDDYEMMLNHLAVFQRVAGRVGREPYLFSGGARGADRLAERAARELMIGLLVFPANWTADGRRAGILRNAEMGRALLTQQGRGATVSVVHFPGGRGTRHMVSWAKSNDLPVFRPAGSVVAV